MANMLKQTKEVVNLKKILAYTLVLLLIATAFAFAPMIPPEIDAVSAATPWVEETPTTPATPSTPTAPVSTVSAPAGSAFHIVVSGDTMFKIAAKYGMTLDQLLTLNPQVTNRDLIFVGQKIAIKDRNHRGHRVCNQFYVHPGLRRHGL
jgi:FOG: LysM repeat